MSIDRSPPSSSLAAELDDVAADAQRLVDLLRADNALSDDFPRIQVEEICHSVGKLKFGTAHTAYQVLYYVSRRLAFIRRKHIAREDLTVAVDDAPPKPIRGMTLDIGFKNLIASSTTAYDEARRQLSLSEDFEEVPEAEKKHDAAGSGADRLSVESAAVAKRFGLAAEEFDRARNPESIRADSLARGLRDAETLGEIASTELRFPTTVANWLKRIGSEILSMPRNIERLGRFIEVGSDLTDFTYIRWSEFWHSIEKQGLMQLRSLGKDLQAYGRSLSGGDPLSSEGAEDMESEVDRRVLVQLNKASKNQRLRALRELWAKYPEHPDTIAALYDGITSQAPSEVRELCVGALIQAYKRKLVGGECFVALLESFKSVPHDSRLTILRALRGVQGQELGRDRGGIVDGILAVLEVSDKPQIIVEATDTLASIYGYDAKKLEDIIVAVFALEVNRKVPHAVSIVSTFSRVLDDKEFQRIVGGLAGTARDSIAWMVISNCRILWSDEVLLSFAKWSSKEYVVAQARGELISRGARAGRKGELPESSDSSPEAQRASRPDEGNAF
jgi:hypothetical protein